MYTGLTTFGIPYSNIFTVTFFGPFVSVLQFLPPHVPTEEEKKAPALFASRVRQTMAQ